MEGSHEGPQDMETDESSAESQRPDPRLTAEERARLARHLIGQDNGYILYRGARQDQRETPIRLYHHGVDPDAQGLACPTPLPNRLKLIWFGPPKSRRFRTPTWDTGKNDCTSSSPRQTIVR